VAVPCSRCGRQYDVALFQFGRTIQCCCGARVAQEPRVRSIARGGPPRFFADTMLGRLARWLRMLGLDTAYEQEIADGTLVRRAIEERRVILTRDRRLPQEWHVDDVLLVRSERTLEQLREVVDAFSLQENLSLFSRCGICNEILVPADRREIAERAPETVRAGGCEVRTCRSCGRLYWQGSHTDRMRRVIEAVTR
jgi:uncharacterized protein with PIN domain